MRSNLGARSIEAGGAIPGRIRARAVGRVLRAVQSDNARGGLLSDEIVLKARQTVLDAQRSRAALLQMKFREIGFVTVALHLKSTRALMIKAIEAPETLIGDTGIWWPSEAK